MPLATFSPSWQMYYMYRTKTIVLLVILYRYTAYIQNEMFQTLPLAPLEKPSVDSCTWLRCIPAVSRSAVWPSSDDTPVAILSMIMENTIP